ncbi:hypothetical protein ACVIW2_004612 [Bradyrhizobium huanghuaihaiense]|uniref:Lectin-like protein BA14k n=1 Tax=Bradyrhizobium huanghuaihaiense TaxID=990078 RepID=A0A562S348_9BRAD|nr:hypothetical protein [Bradyrhizobium huanghuaihaiense]TWI75821.1 hypothetical protein IQ16_00052 [Bradyrhizobium huanghuaihaiense]
MMNPRILGAAVVAASALFSSAAPAQWAQSNPDLCQAEFANCTGLGTGSPPTAPRYRQAARRAAYQQPAPVGAPAAGSWGNPGGWGNSYAMYGGGDGGYGWNGSWSQYAARNGIVCRPGTLYKGADGRQHLCQ